MTATLMVVLDVELMIQPLRKVIVDKAKNPVLAPLEREGNLLGFQSFV